LGNTGGGDCAKAVYSNSRVTKTVAAAAQANVEIAPGDKPIFDIWQPLFC
jgi:hypothetical protein